MQRLVTVAKSIMIMCITAFIGLILGFFIAGYSFYTSSKRLRRKEVIEVNPLMRIVLVVTFLSYLISGLVSSNKELVTETIKSFIANEPFTLSYYSGIDSLNITTNFDIKKQWLTELNLRDNVKIAKLQDMGKVSCEHVGLVIDYRVNLGFVKLADVANTPCPDTMTQKVALVWTGFSWKTFFSVVSGMA